MTNNANDDEFVLTPDEAIAMLPDGDSIHTFRSAGMALIGADWGRDDLERTIRSSRCELGGEQCTAMNHGLVVWTGKDPLFVACKPGSAGAAK